MADIKLDGLTVVSTAGSPTAVTLNNNVSFNNKLAQIAKNATDTPITGGSFINSTSYAWGNSSIEVSITPNKAGNLLILNSYFTGYNDSNDMSSLHTFLISSNNGASFINVATDSNGLGLTNDYVTRHYHYSGTDFGTGASNMLGYYTTQTTDPLKIRSSARVANGQFKYFNPHVIICYEYEVVS
jgi:hypothetical protein